MTAELVGTDPSASELAARIIERSAGNPFYVQEIVREFAERGVLVGERGAYRRQREVADISVPPTLQATIGARIDRLTARAKQTLNAAAVIGSRFSAELLADLLEQPGDAEQAALAELVHSELIDQVMFIPRAEYVFRHPLVQAVAYQSQLKPARAHLHRRLASVIERGNATVLDESAALIAAHLEAAGDLRAAFGWHMRAGTWFTNRDINAARTSWHRARQVADRLPVDEPDRAWLQAVPRALLCGSTWRAGKPLDDSGFDELREFCTGPNTQVPLLIGMAGLLPAMTQQGRVREALQLTPEYINLLEEISEPELTVGLLYPAIYVKYEAAQMRDVLTMSQQVIDLAKGNPTKGNILTGSPLAFATAMRASAECALGLPEWKADFGQAVAISQVDPTTYVSIIMFKYLLGIPLGALMADDTALEETAHALQVAQRCSEDFALHMARLARGITLVSNDGDARTAGFELLAEVRSAALGDRFMRIAVPLIDLHVAAEKARTGIFDHAIEISRQVIDEQCKTGAVLHLGAATSVLVESLLGRGRDSDVAEAGRAIEGLAAVFTDPMFVLYQLPLLRMRSLLAWVRNNSRDHQTYSARYLDLAHTLGFEGHEAIGRAGVTSPVVSRFGLPKAH